MEILLTLIFVILAIILPIIELIIVTKKHNHHMTKKEVDEYIMSSMIIGQKGKVRFF